MPRIYTDRADLEQAEVLAMLGWSGRHHRGRLADLCFARAETLDEPSSEHVTEQPEPWNSAGRRGQVGRWRSRFMALLAGTVWLYLAVVLVVWLLLGTAGDRWWLATIVLFGPRTVYALPLIVLVPLAAAKRRALLRPLAAAALVVIWPLMGLCLPWSRLAASADGPAIRVLSYNVNMNACDFQELSRLIVEARPDVVALQECSGEVPPFWPSTWHVYRQHEFLVASRYPLSDWQIAKCSPLACSWPRMHAVACILETEAGPVRFCCLHLQTPREGLHDVLSKKILINPARKGELITEIRERRQESRELAEWLGRFEGPLILAGDFNMPPDSLIYEEFWGRYANAFSATGLGFGFTKLTPIKGLRYGLRIDHVLSSRHCPPLRCWVGADLNSDHLPLLADLRLPHPGEAKLASTAARR